MAQQRAKTIEGRSDRLKGRFPPGLFVPAPALLGLSEEQSRALVGFLEERVHSRGAYIYNLGQAQQGLYWLRRGLVEEFRLTEQGDHLPINRVRPGEFFGISSDLGIYCCFAQALEDSSVGYLTFARLEEFGRSQPAIMVNLVRWLAHHLGELEHRLQLFAFGGLRTRVAWTLLGLHRIHGERLAGITHEKVASWAGAARPRVSRILEEFQEARAIRLFRAEIEVLDAARLEQLAGP